MVSMRDTLIISYKSEMITIQLFSYAHIYLPKEVNKLMSTQEPPQVC